MQLTLDLPVLEDETVKSAISSLKELTTDKTRQAFDAFNVLIDKGLTVEQIKEVTGISQKTITLLEQLNNLTPELKSRYTKGEIVTNAAKQIAVLPVAVQPEFNLNQPKITVKDLQFVKSSLELDNNEQTELEIEVPTNKYTLQISLLDKVKIASKSMPKEFKIKIDELVQWCKDNG